MVERVLSNPKIKVLWNHILTDILGSEETGVKAAELENLSDGNIYNYPCDGIFLAIGHSPNSEIFGEYLELDKNGYIKPLLNYKVKKQPSFNNQIKVLPKVFIQNASLEISKEDV